MQKRTIVYHHSIPPTLCPYTCPVKISIRLVLVHTQKHFIFLYILSQIGSMLKTPKYPVWVTSVNGVNGVLFCTSRDLTCDWKVERYFYLHYYNGNSSQDEETILSIGNMIIKIDDITNKSSPSSYKNSLLIFLNFFFCKMFRTKSHPNPSI